MKPSLKNSSTDSNRLKKFFKRFFAAKQEDEPTASIYQRDYDRFPMEFEVLVTLIDHNGEKHNDRAALHDISGSGALFLTRMPEKYHLNQALQLKIYLAGTEDVRGCIKAESNVVRIQKVSRDTAEDDPILMGIAVKFYKGFEFERVDKKVFGGSK